MMDTSEMEKSSLNTFHTLVAKLEDFKNGKPFGVCEYFAHTAPFVSFPALINSPQMQDWRSGDSYSIRRLLFDVGTMADFNRICRSKVGADVDEWLSDVVAGGSTIDIATILMADGQMNDKKANVIESALMNVLSIMVIDDNAGRYLGRLAEKLAV